MTTKRQPTPQRSNLSALPSQLARGVAFGSILLGGVLGGLIGFGVMKAQYPAGHRVGKAIGASIGAVLVAAGTAVLAVLVLRAMGEWRQLDTTVERAQLGDRR
jgi:hypothetical protein